MAPSATSSLTLAPVPRATPLDTLVFVYGTLKRGLFNYEAYLEPAQAMGKAEYVGTATTVARDFCLVLTEDRHVPCVYRATASETGYSIPGEVFRVDQGALAALDILEGVTEPTDHGHEIKGEPVYHREEIEVELQPAGSEDSEKATPQRLTCYVYLKVFEEALVALPNVPVYTPELHVAYRSRIGTPKLAILACLYGDHVTDAVKAQMDAGVPFDAAWQHVMGVLAASSE